MYNLYLTCEQCLSLCQFIIVHYSTSMFYIVHVSIFCWSYVRDSILPQTIAAIVSNLLWLVYVNEQIVACSKYILAMIIVM